jgi:hypothetical protein
MVTDATVKKVIMVCDRKYVEKANARAGGVGTESQIISPEIYSSSVQDKFAAVITENTDDGSACIPAYYRGRIYFDFRSGDSFEGAYEQLLRWLVDRPQHVKPKLGVIPESLLAVTPTASGTQSKARRAEEGIRQGATNAAAYVREYGEALLPELKTLMPSLTGAQPADESVLAAVESMRPYGRQFVELVTVTVRYGDDARVWDAILNLLEQIGRLQWRDPELTSWQRHQFDAFKVIAHDLFVSTVAMALDEDRFDLASTTLTRPWLFNAAEGANRPSTSDFTAFNQSVESLEHRNQRLSLSRYSLHADIMHDAHRVGAIPNFESIMQAEFVIFLRSMSQSKQSRWYPFPLLYATNRYSPFPLFARSESAAYFNRLSPVLGVHNISAFNQLIVSQDLLNRTAQMFDYHGLPVKYLANAEFLCSRPS